MIIINSFSHAQEVINAMTGAKQKALEAIGAQCTGYAQMLAPVDTGRLRNSLTWTTDAALGCPDSAVCVGSNVEYAVYQEMGTSKTTAQPYLRPAVEGHMDEYKAIAEKFLRGY